MCFFLVPITMCDKKHKQQINVKVCLSAVISCWKRPMVRILFLFLLGMFLNGIKFFGGWESTEDDQCPAWPVPVSIPQVVTKINEIVRDRRMGIRIISAKTVNTDKDTARKILHDELNMRKVSVKLVPKKMTPDQKLVHQKICSDFLERLDKEPELMENIITCNET